MMESGDGKMKVKLPKVLNKATSRKSTAPYQFSSQNWNSKTTAYRLSVNRRGPEFIQDIFTEAHRRRNQKPGNTDTISPSDASGNGGDVDPRALLCSSFSLSLSPLLMLTISPQELLSLLDWLVSSIIVSFRIGPFSHGLGVSVRHGPVSPSSPTTSHGTTNIPSRLDTRVCDYSTIFSTFV